MELYKNIEGIDVYKSKEIDKSSFQPVFRFYHIREDGNIQYFKVEYNMDFFQDLSKVMGIDPEKELAELVDAELISEISKMTINNDDEYELIPALPPQKKGVKCGECGMKFEYNKSYGYVCGNSRCPMQVRIT